MPAAEVLAATALFCVSAAAIDDVRRYAINDGWPIAITALFAGHFVLVPPTSWLSHLVAPALVFLVGLIGFTRGYIGGGDVKLLTAIAAWTGFEALPDLLVGTAVAGGILALAFIVARAIAPGAGGLRLLTKAAPLPYAVAIAVGTFWAWPGINR